MVVFAEEEKHLPEPEEISYEPEIAVTQTAELEEEAAEPPPVLEKG